MPFFLIRTLGCKVNQYDGERLAQRLINLGFSPARNSAPDFFILNSCSVTVRSAQKVRQELRSAKSRWPNSKIFLAGCEAKLREKDGLDSPDADGVIMPTHSNEDLLRIFDETGIQTSFEFKDAPGNPKQSSQPCSTARTRAFIKIQDGCSQFCAYCIVPFLRGTERSRPIEDIVYEAKSLSSHGFREIVITGIHLGRYQFGLPNVLRALEEISGIDRIRLSSIEPLEVDQPLIDWVSSSPKSCFHFHIPLQSGSNKILRSMKRPYDKEAFQGVVGKIREKVPEVGLTTDLIVGFPGETDQDFYSGIKFIEAMEFSKIHIFRYSPRPHTLASTFPSQVPPNVKQDRVFEADCVNKRLSEKFFKKFENRKVEVLWENQSLGVWKGYSREYIPCRKKEATFLGKNLLEVVQVKSTDNLGAWCE
ncbi:tRNA (N(6)-L-threonylcarbamoyladenosine(37)-C(2))-methylthiotransferase MtaB [bacterium]|nr:tRNA (N(6)-L-threonylcarbamoyladenosine(37)-C(2))-methylthiotransferase MtaB [bacterium]